MRIPLHRLGLIVLLCGSVSLTVAAQQEPRAPGHDRPGVRPHHREDRPAEPRVQEQPNAAVAPQSPTIVPPAPAIQQPSAQPSQPVTQNPPVPPQVSYEGGELTIAAPNSNLADVLNAVKAKTGANLELPPSAGQERVAVQLGPGPPRDVLAQLLDGSPFDYILLGAPNQPNSLTDIVLTRTTGGGATPPSGTSAAIQAQPTEEEPSEPTTEAVQPSPVQQEPPTPIAPGARMPADQNATGEPAPNAAPAQGNQVKTPEQLLQELQRMQQREQQQRQQPPPKPPQ